MLQWKVVSSPLGPPDPGDLILGHLSLEVATQTVKIKKKKLTLGAIYPRVSLICSELWTDLLNKGHLSALFIEQFSKYGMEKEWENFVLIMFLCLITQHLFLWPYWLRHHTRTLPDIVNLCPHMVFNIRGRSSTPHCFPQTVIVLVPASFVQIHRVEHGISGWWRRNRTQHPPEYPTHSKMEYIILLNSQLTLKKLSVLEISRIVTKIYQHVINLFVGWVKVLYVIASYKQHFLKMTFRVASLTSAELGLQTSCFPLRRCVGMPTFPTRKACTSFCLIWVTILRKQAFSQCSWSLC